ncbi:hypothetical protein AB0K60_35645 [Thermopolyspora sp. NPDC052614]|uniref:hypothetical protein n=1 Tax=Thermopolyspora sp. NPDC052614 TaxID=3155682 RepID=UPI003448E0EA
MSPDPLSGLLLATAEPRRERTNARTITIDDRNTSRTVSSSKGWMNGSDSLITAIKSEQSLTYRNLFQVQPFLP